MRRFLLIAALGGVTGCISAGDTVHVVSVSPASVTLSYTHTYDMEYAATVQRAEASCQQYGKHARPSGPPVKISMDRSTASFDCVP